MTATSDRDRALSDDAAVGTPLLDVRDLVIGYGRTQVLKQLSLVVQPGEAIAVLGANGAGKSTLMATIAGLMTPWSGSVSFAGQDLAGMPADERAGLGLVLAPEGRGIFTSLSIEENLKIGGTALKRRFGAAEAKRHLAEGLERVYGMFDVLGRRRTNMGGELSGGQQQMLAIGRALIAQPRLLLLDEPCLGLAPKVGNDVYDVLHRLREEGQSLVVVEESSRRALEFVDRACILKLGEKVLEDRASAMQGDDILLEAYFGIEQAETKIETATERSETR
ncbi:ABC transporter ATP-binding protein [Conexibacter sp. CPCC 206217]|uniref:ABC transporter ATP-binding protein n=1 Tax=Conexibacter sp. CPCC 206217 TaxID=3064574 RepID=UPI00271BFD72|nr:ABC transporter ATP-binding protein [Conexibacter sp. CPCC 206217]MDO8209569.1 ABC transporter ATP-binding protein [Conexibacter sp. CPCC 206217]